MDQEIRQPGGIRAIGRDDSEEDDDENNLAVGPFQQSIGNIAKIQKVIKKKAVSASPQTPITPAIKQSPNTPESRKMPKFSFKTESKRKRLLPKTPKKKESPSSAYNIPRKSLEELVTELPFIDEGGTTPWKTPADIARENTRKLRRQTRQSRAEERKQIGLQNTATKRALKKLAQAPGGKPFGTSTKRKLDRQDW